MKNVCKQSETCEKISARINPQLSSQNWKSQEIPIFGLIFSIFVQNITIWGDFKVLSESKIKKLNPYKMSQLSSISVFSHVFLTISNFWSEANTESRKTPNFGHTRTILCHLSPYFEGFHFCSIFRISNSDPVLCRISRNKIFQAIRVLVKIIRDINSQISHKIANREGYVVSRPFIRYFIGFSWKRRLVCNFRVIFLCLFISDSTCWQRPDAFSNQECFSFRRA